MLPDEREPGLRVHEDDLGRAGLQREYPRHLADGAGAEDGDGVAGVDGGVVHGVVARGQHVAQVQRLLVGHAVRDGEEVHVAERDADVLGLAAREAAGEVGVPEHAGGAAAVHGALGGVGVGALALRGELLRAEEAGAARDLEGGDVAGAEADFVRGDGGAEGGGDAAELVAQDVAWG